MPLELQNSLPYLYEAIKCGDVKKAQSLLWSGVDVNSYFKDNTPLHWAVIFCEQKESDMVKMLLDEGADLHAKNLSCQKPLDLAIKNRKTRAASALLRRGALNGEDINHLFFKTIRSNNHNIVRMLIYYGMKRNASIDFQGLFNAAILRENWKIIDAIIPHCAFPNSSELYLPPNMVIKADPRTIDCVKVLLRWNFTIRPDCYNNGDFIYGAFENGHLPIVKQLLERGIDVNMMNPQTGLNLITIACLHRHHEIVALLLQHNANVNVKIPSDNPRLSGDPYFHPNRLGFNFFFRRYGYMHILIDVTCLHVAVFNKDPVMIDMLLRHGAKTDDYVEFFNLACYAVYRNWSNIVDKFLEFGVKVTDVNAKKESLLNFCFNYYYKEQDTCYDVAKFLLDRGADIHLKTPNNTLVLKAMKKKHRKIAQLFLDYGADVQYNTRYNESLLHAAIKNEAGAGLVRSLLERDIPVNTMDCYEKSPLFDACDIDTADQLEIIRALLHYGAAVNCTSDNMTTPLHCVSNGGNLEIIKLLLSEGADPNAKDEESQTPLHYACEDDFVSTSSIVQLFLEYGANLDAVDHWGRTPLLIACDHNNYAAAEVLLTYGADIDHTDEANSTSLHITCKSKNGTGARLIQLLLEHGADIEAVDDKGWTPLLAACHEDKYETAKFLIDNHANVNARDNNQQTPLHLAVKQTSIEIIKYLLKCGANINSLDENNQTALQVAIESFKSIGGLRYHWNMDNFRKMITILKTQVVKLVVAGLKVNKKNFKIVYDLDDSLPHDFDVQQVDQKCQQEIYEMKKEYIIIEGETEEITLDDFLKKHDHFIRRFVDNEELQILLGLSIFDKKYPLYIDIIRCRFRDVKCRHEVVNFVKEYLYKNVCPGMPEECIDMMLSYLSVAELRMFIDTVKLLDE